MFEPLKILLLCDEKADNLQNAILDHIASFKNMSRHVIVPFNPRDVESECWVNFEKFDVVLIHFSLWIIWDTYLPPAVLDRIKQFKKLKVLFIQDEYRLVSKTIDRISELGIHVLFSVAGEEMSKKIYDDPRMKDVTIYQTLTGFVPENLVNYPTVPISERTIDVGYRAREVPFWWGKLGYEKEFIGREFAMRSSEFNIHCDISSKVADRIFGKEWVSFMSGCKATLGTESGTSITDFDGEVEHNTKKYLRTHPDADYESVHKNVLAPFEGNVIFKAVSPRIFEAAALRTALILFPGAYSGALKPWDHYIPLEKDFSNIEEVCSIIRDEKYLQDMADRTYSDIVETGVFSYRKFIAETDEILFRENQFQSNETPSENRAKESTSESMVIREGIGAYIKRYLEKHRLRLAIFIALIKYSFRKRAGVITSSIQRQHLRMQRFFVMLGVCLNDRPSRQFILRGLLNNNVIKGNILRLIAELARMVILRRGGLKSPDNGRNVSVTLGINENRELIYFLHENGQCNEIMEPVDQVSFESVIKSNQVEKILFKSNLSRKNFPRFFEEEILGFSVLIKLAPLYPDLMADMVFGDKS